MHTNEKRPRMIANGWMQAAGIVLIVGFFIMGILTYCFRSASCSSTTPSV